MFDEYLEPPRVERPVSPTPAVQAPVNSAGTPSSTAIDQDAPSPSISPSSLALQSHSLHQGIAAESTFMEDNPIAPIDNNPFINCCQAKLMLLDNAAEARLMLLSHINAVKMRIEQYFLMTDYSLWEVILNGDSPVPTRLVEVVLLNERLILLSGEMSVSAVCAKLPVSSLPNVDSLSNAVIYSFFSSQSTSPQLDNEDLKQIDVYNLNKMDLRWQMAMLTMRARRFLQKTGRNLGDNGPTSMGFDMSKVECYNCHRKGHFARERRSPKDSRRNCATEPQRRTVPRRSLPTLLLWIFHLRALLLIMRPTAPIIEDWVFDSEDESETKAPQIVPSFVQSTKQVKTPRNSIQPVETSIPAATPKSTSPKSNSRGKRRNRKTCFVCKSVDHLIKDYDYHAKKMAQPIPRNYAHKGNNKQNASLTHKPPKHMVPVVVLTQSKLVSITVVRPVSAAVPKIMVTRPRLTHQIVTKSKSLIRRHITRSQSSKTSNSPPRVTAELKFNLFSVSQMCDKKNSVLFTDTECLVLSPDFKLPDESQVLLRVPSSAQSRKQDDKTKKEAKGKSHVEYFTRYRDLSEEFEDCSENNSNEVNVAELEDITYSDDENDVDAEADFNNLETFITVSLIPTTRIYNDHPVSQIIGDLSSTTQTRSMTRVVKDQGGHSQMLNDDFHTRMFACFLSQEEPKRVHQALKDPSWIKPITIEEEVYVCQPLGFEDPNHPDKVYKVVKVLYGLHQGPKAWYETLANYLLENGFQRGKIDQTLFIKNQKGDILLVQIYVDDIIFGLRVKQKKDGIFISQDKYVAEILRKFGLTEGKSASTPIDTEKPLLKDPDGEDVERKKQTVIATSSTKAKYVPAASCCAQVLWIQNQLLDYGYIKYALTVNPNIYVSCIKQFWNTVAIKHVNDVTRLQALVDKKKVVVTEDAIRKVLRLDDVEGVDCLPNEEIFTEMARMSYEKPSIKLTFYKAFFSSYSAMASAVICLSTGQEIEEGGDEEEHIEDVTAGDAAQGDDTAAHGEVPTVSQEPSIPSPTPPTPPPEPPQDLPSTSQGRIIDKMDKDDDVALMDEKEEGKKDEEAKEDKPAEVQEVVDVVTTAKLIREVVTAASKIVAAASVIISTVEPQVPAATITAAPTRVVATPSRRRKGAVIRDPKEESTTSLIIHAETKSKDKGKRIMVKEPKLLKKKQQIKMDEEYARKLHAELNEDIDWDVAIDHVKLKAKEDPVNVAGFKLDYFKGMSYDDIHPIFEANFNSDIEFLLKTKEQIKKEENRALQSINETTVQKATIRRKLNEEVEDLKRHMEIVSNEDDDVYTKAIPLARKVHVVDYKIIELNNKPYYKIIRTDGTHQLYISFLTLLKIFDREYLEALWSLVKERFSTSKPKNIFDDFLLTTLGAMFEKPDTQAQV
nr:hypothetical protein [Tanacetum cinerariifolium]